MGPQIPQRLTDQTAERLLHMIGSDPAYRPGAKLPNEPRLCELFGVSRTTLREAVRSLAAQGYVEVRRGSGTFVLDRASAPDIGLQRLESLRTRLRDLFEIRMMIEPQAARLACLRGTDEELREIAHRAQCVARAIREGENFTQPEEAFHQAFVAATHNPFMEQLLPTMPSTKPGLPWMWKRFWRSPPSRTTSCSWDSFSSGMKKASGTPWLPTSGAPSTCWIKPASAAFEFYPR